MYPNVNMEKKGIKLKIIIKASGYDVKYIQWYLRVSCSQPIYRWFKRKFLLSVDHLYALSGLLGVYMEDLLVTKQQSMTYDTMRYTTDSISKRLLCYYKQIQKIA